MYLTVGNYYKDFHPAIFAATVAIIFGVCCLLACCRKVGKYCCYACDWIEKLRFGKLQEQHEDPEREPEHQQCQQANDNQGGP